MECDSEQDIFGPGTSSHPGSPTSSPTSSTSSGSQCLGAAGRPRSGSRQARSAAVCEALLGLPQLRFVSLPPLVLAGAEEARLKAAMPELVLDDGLPHLGHSSGHYYRCCRFVRLLLVLASPLL